MHDGPIRTCPVCGSKNLKASERQIIGHPQTEPGEIISYRRENGHVILPSRLGGMGGRISQK
jgi:hypothetical protein